MNWNEAQKINWQGSITNLEAKKQVVNQLLEKVKDGDIIGFGSGSTAFLAIQAIAAKNKQENLNITAIPTSYEIELLCQNLNIPTTTNAIDGHFADLKTKLRNHTCTVYEVRGNGLSIKRKKKFIDGFLKA